MTMIFKVFGGLALFFIGMKYMTDGVQSTAGKKLRSMIAAVTDNRLAGCATGLFVTSIVQSSSLTTVLLVGLVNAGVMTLQQSIGVMLGADIGTTVTAWLVSLDVLAYGLPMIAVATIGFLFSKNEKVRLYSMIIVGLGLLFFGLQLMKDGIGPLKEYPGFINFFSMFEPNGVLGLIKCIFIGAFVTAVLQSSSATVAITITLASLDVIGIKTAVALVLGENIGTTVTALLASIGGTIAARRVACAHAISKTIGVFIILCLFIPYWWFLNKVWGTLDMHDVGKQIAISHTIFNIVLVCLFLTVTKTYARFITWLVKDKGEQTGKTRVTYLDVTTHSSPSLGIAQSAHEITRMADRSSMMLEDLRACLLDNDNEQAQKAIFEGEVALDEAQHEIVRFLSKLVQGNVSTEINAEMRKQIRLADEYESISDYVATILKLILRKNQNNVTFSEQATQEILAMHTRVSDFVAMVTTGTRPTTMISDYFVRIETEDAALKHLYKQQRDTHMDRIAQGKCDTVPGMIYADIMQAYRKIVAHAHNIAETIAGEK